MLVLKRKVNQCVYIGDDIKVWITGINQGQVSIGIEAPKEVGIFREEIYERIQKEKDEDKFNQ